jgi:FKBP-type peptidyl-prolyl cis-trans isomerase 2
MPIKANDFVEIEYTGIVKDSGLIFDTTDEKIAKEHELPKAQYGPVVVVIGQGQLLKGLEEQIIGKEPGNFKVELAPEKAFGKKNAKLIQMVPAKKFVDQKIQPVPGLQLNIDGMVCTIRQVTGGRVMVDFNHPLAGREIVYEVKVKGIVTDKKEQLKAVFAMLLNLAPEKMEIEGTKAKIELKQELPKEIVPELQKKVKELTGIDAEIKTAEKKAENGKAAEKKAPEKKEPAKGERSETVADPPNRSSALPAEKKAPAEKAK